MKEFDYRGLAALIIAACAAIGVFIITPIALILKVELGDGRVLIAIGGALIGAFATYMGMRLVNGNDIPPHTKVQTPPKTAQDKDKTNEPNTS